MSEVSELKVKAIDLSKKLKEIEREFTKTQSQFNNLLKEIEQKEEKPEESKS